MITVIQTATATLRPISSLSRGPLRSLLFSSLGASGVMFDCSSYDTAVHVPQAHRVPKSNSRPLQKPNLGLARHGHMHGLRPLH
jgi:hypothetical protein